MEGIIYMKIEDQLALSFYRELQPLNAGKTVYLASHVDTGELYIKRVYHGNDGDVYCRLKEQKTDGIPECILAVKDTDTGTLTVIEKFICGRNLSACTENGAELLPEKQIIYIMTQLCSILDHLHSMHPPVIHRDIKPSNVMIDTSGNVYLIDFGISREFSEERNHDTQVMGTAGYAAPEQYGFMQTGPFTDIFSAGVLLKYLLTGTNTDIYDYSGKFADIIHKATAMDPSDRYESAESMMTDILVASAETTYSGSKENCRNSTVTPDSRNADSYRKKKTEPEKKKREKTGLFGKTWYFTPARTAAIASVVSLFLGYATMYSSPEYINPDQLSPVSRLLNLMAYSFVFAGPFLYYAVAKNIQICRNDGLMKKTAVHTVFFIVFYFASLTAILTADYLLSDLSAGIISSQ